MDRLVNIIDQPNWKIMLYDLVKSNELDLWNVNLINLANLYLDKIKSMKMSNLLVPANALLAAAILLKLKTYSLKLTTIQNDDEDDFKLLKDGDFALNNSIDLNTPMRLKEGQVSLDELIDVIDVMMNRPVKKSIEKKLLKKQETVFTLPPKTKDISKRIDDLFLEIQNNMDSENLVLFSKFKSNLNNNQSIVDDYFIPMLFLAMDNKINIWQEEFFSDIFIKVVASNN